jgi:hypothetical protein
MDERSRDDFDRLRDQVDDLAEVVHVVNATLERFQADLTNYMQGMTPVVNNFNTLVMDPIKGVVVEHRHLENAVRHLDTTVSDAVKRLWALDDIVGRMKKLEEDAMDRKQGRLKTKDLVIGALVVVATSVASSLLILRLTGQV